MQTLQSKIKPLLLTPTAIFLLSTSMAKDAFVWMDMQELMVFVKQLETMEIQETQQIIQLNHLLLVLPIQSWPMEIVFVILGSQKLMAFASNQANVEPIVTTMVWAFVFVTLDSIKQLTEVVWLEQHAHHQVQETTKEIVFVMQVWPNTEIIALNVHLEPFSTMLLKNVFMYVDKTLPTILLNKNVFALLVMVLQTKFVQNAQLTTLFRTTIALLAQLTQLFLQLRKNVNVLMVSY